jgi:serine/threonine-protein kinase
MYLDPGSHVVSISGPGYAPYEQTVTLVAGSVSTLEPVLASATIDLDAVSVSEAPPGESSEAESARARASLPAAMAGHVSKAPAAVKPVPVVLEETPENPYPGLLAASSNPSAMLVVDGHPLGQSPRAVDLQPGIHTVVFVHPELGRKSMTVSIWAGKTTNVAVDF